MTKYYLAAILVLLAACSDGTPTKGGTQLHANQIPVAVTAAFTSEHPYAKINGAMETSSGDGTKLYSVAYTAADGATGKAIYAETGALLKDGQ